MTIFHELSDGGSLYFFLELNLKYLLFGQYKSFTGILKKNVLAKVYKKFQRSQHAEMYLLALVKAQDKLKMNCGQYTCFL